MQCLRCSADLRDSTVFCPACGSRIARADGADGDSLRRRLQDAVEGEYALLRLLGRGGMGAVYLSRELALERLVGIKVLPPEASNDPERRGRFQREAQLAAHLTHPNIVPLHRFGNTAGLSYYVMGFVRGESLAERLRRDGQIPPDEARQLLAQLADALEYAHGKGVVHRDIKPDNILIDDETGRPMLADFGIARSTADADSSADAGRIEGTLHYMSPEQTVGGSFPDGRSDIYSLGVVGYVMLSGQTPFTARTFAEFARVQAVTEPPALNSLVPHVPSDLAAAIMRALTRNANERWPDARTFKEALGASLDDDPDRLPGELREMSSAVFYSVAVGWLGAILLPLVLPAQIGAWARWAAAIFLAAAFVATGMFHHRKGFTWAEMRQVALWPPGWWPFWWPRAYRRPWDLWDRLPPSVRRLRIAYGIVVILLMITLPLTLIAASRKPLLVLLAAAQAAVTGLMVFTAWWAYRNGIPNNADLRSLVLRSSSDKRFWKRPQMASRLLPVDSPRPASAETPADYTRQIAEATSRMTRKARDTGMEAVAVARSVCTAITDLDNALANTPDEADATRGDALRTRRAHLASELRALWQHQSRLAHDGTDAAIRSVAMQVASLSFAMNGSATEYHSDGSPLAATGTQVKRPTHADEVTRS